MLLKLITNQSVQKKYFFYKNNWKYFKNNLKV